MYIVHQYRIIYAIIAQERNIILRNNLPDSQEMLEWQSAREV